MEWLTKIDLTNRNNCEFVWYLKLCKQKKKVTVNPSIIEKNKIRIEFEGARCQLNLSQSIYKLFGFNHFPMILSVLELKRSPNHTLSFK